MDRRGFVGATLAGVGGFFFSRKLKAADDQWWEEKDFVFEGISGTEYLFPRDRLIHLEDPATLPGKASGVGGVFACYAQIITQRDTIIVPTFSLLVQGSSVEENMRAAVEAQKLTNGDKYCGSHIHLIRVKGLPNEVGLMMHSEKCHPVTDCWADAGIREQQALERQKEKKRSEQRHAQLKAKACGYCDDRPFKRRRKIGG